MNYGFGMSLRNKQVCFLLAMLLANYQQAFSRGCSTSREFTLKRVQHFSGVLEDPNGQPLPGVEVQLIAAGETVQNARTDRDGKYHFAELGPGKYRIRVSDGGNAFCAPSVHCNATGCTPQSKLKLDRKQQIVVK